MTPAQTDLLIIIGAVLAVPLAVGAWNGLGILLWRWRASRRLRSLRPLTNGRGKR